MRNVRHFWIYFIMFAGILFLFLSNDFGLVDVQRTAIITGLALDKEEGELLLTADLAVPSSSEKGENTSPVQVSAKAKTVAQALEKIGEKVGWAPKLVYCRVLLLGEELTREDCFHYLDYFLRNEYFSDNCVLLATQGQAKELLSVKTPVDNIVTLALLKIITGEAYSSGRCVSVLLKDFAIGYYGDTKSGFLPIVKAEEPVKKVLNTKSGANQGGGEEKQEEQVFSVSTTALFFEGKRQGELNEEETFVLNLLRTRLRNSAYQIATDKGDYCVNLKQNKGKVRFFIQDGVPRLQVNLTARASISDRAQASSIKELTSSPILPSEVKRAVEKKLENAYESLFEKCRKTNCDVYGVLDKLRRYENEYFDAYQKDVLRLTKPTFTVKVISSAR